MPFTVGLDLAPEIGMVPTPALVAFAKLLALPGVEIEQAVAQEISENPALVQEEPRTCGACGLPADPPCPYCAAGAGQPRISESHDGRQLPVEATAATPVSWAEALLSDLRLVLPKREAGVAAVVVASLDERGYLTEATSELAWMTRTDVATVERVVQALRETGPIGVGARDLRDCLLLQIDRRADEGLVNPLARAVVADHLEALARGAMASIARQLGVGVEEIAEARAFIRRELQPRPSLPGDPAPDDPAAVPVQPDVAVVERSDLPPTLRVEVLEELRMPVRVDPSFRRAARDNDRMAELVRRGDFFLARLRERWSTMRRITEYLVEQRSDLVGGDPAADCRITRVEVATGLGLSPSTVSRATAGKYVLLPSRRVVPFAAFFDGSLGLRARLRTIIESEERPLTDAELAERLRRAGHHVARRTVAKYRGRLQVLPSTYR